MKIQTKIDRDKNLDKNRFNEHADQTGVHILDVDDGDNSNSNSNSNSKNDSDGGGGGGGNGQGSPERGTKMEGGDTHTEMRKGSVASPKRGVGMQRQGTRADFYNVLSGLQLARGDEMGEGEENLGEDIVSQQLSLLQERIDKIYAMLTTKLGRLR